MDLTGSTIRRKRQAEQLFAAAAYLRPEEAIEQCGWLTPDKFNDERVRTFWAALLETKDNSKAALAVGYDYLAELAINASELAYTPGVAQFAEKVADESWLVCVGDNLGHLANALLDGDKIRVISLLASMNKEQPVQTTAIPDAADIGIDFIASLEEEDHTIRTHIPQVDAALGGLWRGTESVICARPRIGKTALAFQIARNCAANSQRVLYISLEMKARFLWARAACGSARITYRDILTKKVSEADLERVIECNNNLIEAMETRLMIDDSTPQTTADLWRKVAAVKPDLLVVDHIRLLADKADNEVKRLGEITWNLKQIAKYFDIHVLAIAQLNRLLEHRPANERVPTLMDLRDSGEIEENADVILGLHRDQVYIEAKQTKPTSPAELVVMKFRDGPSSIKIRLMFDGLGQWFEGLP